MPHIRDIQHHSSHRAFKFNLQQEEVVMFYKNTPIDKNWTGYHSTYGLQLMHSHPVGIPHAFLSPPFPPEDLKDIPSMYHFMDEKNQNWWKSFIEDQTILHPTNDTLSQFDEDFWLNEDERSMDIESQEDVTDHHELAPITIPLHPLVDPEIEINSLVAVISEDKSTYWIGEVKHCKRSKGQVIYTLRFYRENSKGVWKKMKKSNEESIGIATIESILLSNIKFTKKGTLPVNTDKKLTKLINSW